MALNPKILIWSVLSVIRAGCTCGLKSSPLSEPRVGSNAQLAIATWFEARCAIEDEHRVLGEEHPSV
ncbi:hypothetical protein HJFPF1_01989 [Paramyrothecium foliicola]|nr:hypothetical protein HJFPF1_01989 [Paramyrothecium foliicola]